MNPQETEQPIQDRLVQPDLTQPEPTNVEPIQSQETEVKQEQPQLPMSIYGFPEALGIPQTEELSAARSTLIEVSRAEPVDVVRGQELAVNYLIILENMVNGYTDNVKQETAQIGLDISMATTNLERGMVEECLEGLENAIDRANGLRLGELKIRLVDFHQGVDTVANRPDLMAEGVTSELMAYVCAEYISEEERLEIAGMPQGLAMGCMITILSDQGVEDLADYLRANQIFRLNETEA